MGAEDSIQHHSPVAPLGYGRSLPDGWGGPPAYTGAVGDLETARTYLGARYLHGARFMNIDPAPLNPTHPAGLNRYAYANNNPVRFTDPNGRYSCEGSREDCKTVDRYVNNIRDAARSRNLNPREQAQVRAVSSYLGRKGQGGPQITPVALEDQIKARTDQRGNIKIDVREDSSGVSPVASGAMALGHEAQHNIDALEHGEVYTPEESIPRERNAYATEALIGRANRVFLSPAAIEVGIRGSIESVFGPVPEELYGHP